MRILKLPLLLFFVTTIGAHAQDNDIRLLSTKIADVLATMPAQNNTQLDKSMQSITALGSSGLRSMIGSFAPTGSGDNTALEFALSAYAAYVNQPGKDAERHAAVAAYCSGLDSVSDSKNRQFLLYQLQRFGKDDAVGCVGKFINDKEVGSASIRALAQIKTPSAQQALFNALPGVNPDLQPAIVEALGYVKSKAAVPAIEKLAATENDELRKVALQALASIGSASSANLLSSAASKAQFTWDRTNATASYLQYLENLAGTNRASAAKYATRLMQDAGTANQLHTRIAALKVLVDINGQQSLPLLYAAMKDKDIEYRAAALEYAGAYRNAATNARWESLLNTATPDAQVQLLSFISKGSGKAALPALKKYLDNKDERVKMAAIAAVARAGQEESVPLLISTMEKGDAATIAACGEALQLVRGEGVAAMVTSALSHAKPAAKVALLNVLQARSAGGAAQNVFKEIDNSNPAVRVAAMSALPAVASEKDLPKIFERLNNSKPDELPYFQQAVIRATSSMKDTAERSALVLKQMGSAGNQSKAGYFDILAAIGGAQALNELQGAFDGGDEMTKIAAVAALSKAQGAATARRLMKILSGDASSAIKDTALNGYIGLIRKSKLQPDQKLLMVEDAMEHTSNSQQKNALLEQAADCRSINALLFAARFLDDGAVQQQAALAIYSIISSNNDLGGELVRDALTRAMDVITGRDAEYQKKAIRKYLDEMPAGEGFVALFNSKDLSGWKGLVANPIIRAKMSPDSLKVAQQRADEVMKEGWSAKDGLLVFSGHGENLCTVKQYGDFEMYVDWKITPSGDAGIYLRGTPQVQIWDTSRREVGAQVGSGGLYNNEKHESKPLVLADNAIGEWNTFHIIMRGDKVTVYLNGKLVTDHTTLENYWDRTMPIFPKEQIELQAHGTYVAYRNIYLKELSGSETFELSEQEKKDGFRVLFDGTNLDEWTGNKVDYKVDNGDLLVDPKTGEHGNLYTRDEFSDFIYRFEFQLTPGANNGVGIRAPLEGDAAYVGMEIQVLDNDAPVYKDLHEYQYHGSVYGVIPAKRGFLKPMGEWNYEEIEAKGNRIKVTLNGEVILDGDIAEASKNGTVDHNQHPGLKRKSGHIGFLGHGSVVRFRNIRVKEL